LFVNPGQSCPYDSLALFIPQTTILTNCTADLKRELISEQVKWEISELNSPTALRRFGAPFKSPLGELSPLDSELPILRYIFVHHVREFPFLDKAKEKEFWQDKLQVVGLPPSRFESLGKQGADVCRRCSLVPRIVCEQEHLVFGGSAGRDQEAEAGHQGAEAGRADDGVGNPNVVGFRGEN
jgi:hypothetical protein